MILGTINAIGRHKKEKLDWSAVELNERLPKPKSNVGIIFSNDDERLSVEVKKTSKSDYKAYVEECESMGYTVESEKDGER